MWEASGSLLANEKWRKGGREREREREKGVVEERVGPVTIHSILISESNKSNQKVQTLAKVAHYHHIARIPDLESEHIDPDHLKNLINCLLYHRRAILNISSICLFIIYFSFWFPEFPGK